MIGLGSQYLTAAGFGRYRITAASLGNLDLLGTFRWLTKATKQAIVGAFGQRDGKAVINATNAYLNQLAASDRDKATALAGFINEDPMMVCSLGLEPELTVLPAMPVRMLVGTNRGRINLGPIVTESTCEVKAIVQHRGTTLTGFFGTRYGNQGYVQYATPGTGWRHDWPNGTSSYSGTCVKNQLYRVQVRKGYLKIDDTVLVNTTYTEAICTNDFYLLDAYATNGYQTNAMAMFNFKDSTKEYEMYPFIRNGVVGAIDVLSDTFHVNANQAGTLSIDYGYMYNGSWVTWTPATP